jgi:hypothetical protein
MGYGPGSDSAESPPPTGGRPSSGGNAGILATLVPTGFRQPHMIESMAQGGPSHASGQVQAGDLLLEVDSADVRALSLKDIQSKIIGRPGTQVTLTLQRGKRNFPHKVTLTRSARRLQHASPACCLLPAVDGLIVTSRSSKGDASVRLAACSLLMA